MTRSEEIIEILCADFDKYETAIRICQLFPKAEENPEGCGQKPGAKGYHDVGEFYKDEPESKLTYTLSCLGCEEPYGSAEAFPAKQLCRECLKLAQDAKTRTATLKEIGEWLAKKDQDIESAFADWYLITKDEIKSLKEGELPEVIKCT